MKEPCKCADCSEPWPANYMVHNEVWKTAWPTYLQDKRLSMMKYKQSDDNRQYLVLCLKCLQKRLGRPLVLEDFTEKPVNDGIRFGYAMARGWHD